MRHIICDLVLIWLIYDETRELRANRYCGTDSFMHVLRMLGKYCINIKRI